MLHSLYNTNYCYYHGIILGLFGIQFIILYTHLSPPGSIYISKALFGLNKSLLFRFSDYIDLLFKKNMKKSPIN